MKTIQMLVTLKIPDATALSALQALHEMGYKNLKNIERALYYRFSISGDELKFKGRISKADILVNSNKHTASFSIPKDKNKVVILVEDKEQGDGLLPNLRDRLGFSGLKRMRRGTLWMFSIEGKDAKGQAKEMTEVLLCNENYQDYTLL